MGQFEVDNLIGITTDTNITVKGQGTGKVSLGDGNLLFPDSDGSADQLIKTNGSGVLSFADAGGGGATDINGLSDAITNSSGATIGLGTGALANDNGTTNKNTAVGYGALNSNISGEALTAVGYEALEAHTENSDCTAIGYQALYFQPLCCIPQWCWHQAFDTQLLRSLHQWC